MSNTDEPAAPPVPTPAPEPKTCGLCEVGHPIVDGFHIPTQRLGMIPVTRCRKLPAVPTPAAVPGEGNEAGCKRCGCAQERHVGMGGGCLQCLKCDRFVYGDAVFDSHASAPGTTAAPGGAPGVTPGERK